MTEEKKITVSRVIDAPAKDIFRVLSDPQNHARIDGTGMIQSDEKTDRITANGQTFRMNMHNERFNDYQMDNHVTGYAENKLLAWMPGMVGATNLKLETSWKSAESPPMTRPCTPSAITRSAGMTRRPASAYS